MNKFNFVVPGGISFYITNEAKEMSPSKGCSILLNIALTKCQNIIDILEHLFNVVLGDTTN